MYMLRSEIFFFAGHFEESYSRGQHHCSENCFENSWCEVKEQPGYLRNNVKSTKLNHLQIYKSVTLRLTVKTIYNKQQQTNFMENWKITDYITFPPANSLI